MRNVMVFVLPMLVAAAAGAEESLVTVPAGTAYFEPDRGAQVLRSDGSENHVRWQAADTSIHWFGQFRKTGMLQACVQVSAFAQSENRRFRLSVGDQSQTAVAEPNDAHPEQLSIDFGRFTIEQPGYVRIRLQQIVAPATASSSDQKQPPNSHVELQSLQLTGPATQDAHFNLKPRRNAASVHLFYPVRPQRKVAAFYCRMTALEDPLWSYYMACGWHRGYFGMQVNSPTERRIIFSVWDSGNEAVDRKKVEAENRVRLVGKGEGVYAGDFGNEGTGGHSHLKYNWKTGTPQHFVVTAEPVDETHTIYAGYYLHPERQEWMLISSWNAPFEGGHLRGLYSFSENFVGRNGHLLRKALYADQWIRTAAGDWIELSTARFSFDGTGRGDRLDRFMGLQDGQFFLSHGGFKEGFTEFGKSFERPSTGKRPQVLDRPGLPFNKQAAARAE